MDRAGQGSQRLVFTLAAVLTSFTMGAEAQTTEWPQLQIEAPPALAAVRTRLESFDPKQLADILALVGLTDAGPAIQVVLATESSAAARQVSPWTAGFALGTSGVVVLFPARSPGYPHNSLEDVLRHEVAHVLIARATDNGPVPRWFNEGLAMAAERDWGLQDQTRLLYELVLGPRTTVGGIDRLFTGNRNDQIRAYALAGAFVRDLRLRHGPSSPREVLTRMKRGVSFEAAFADVAGLTLAAAESEFWQRQRVWTTWVPILTSSATLWLAVTVLAIYAIRRRRRKNAEIEKAWAEEEEETPQKP